MYEGRTRGKKLKYTYSEDEGTFSEDEPSARRSTRNAAPTEASTQSRRPRFTASGRQIRSRAGGLYGEALLYGQRDGADDEEFDEEEDDSRPQRARTSMNPNGYSGYAAEDLEDASDVHSSANDSGNEWRGVDDDLENDFEGDDEEEASADESDENDEPESLVVQLRYSKGDAPSNPEIQVDKPPPVKDVEMKDSGAFAAASDSVQAPPSAPHPAVAAVQQLPVNTHVSSAVPMPQMPPQSVPAMTAPSIEPVPKSPELISQGSMATSTQPSQVAHTAGTEALKHTSTEFNGVNGS